jgi:hypothetical protein
MKDQYVGDVNDFLKYGLLRAFQDETRLRLLVAWMLTAPDEGSDGGLVHYLDAPASYRGIDPVLFDALRDTVSTGRRSTAAIEATAVLRDACFHRAPVPVERAKRAEWFAEVLALAQTSDLTFLDPDNGVEVASVAPGRRNSDKYLLVDELRALCEAGHSICVYQHFPRVQRAEYVATLLDRIRGFECEFEAFALYSSRIAFLIGGAASSLGPLLNAAERVADAWGNVVRIQR